MKEKRASLEVRQRIAQWEGWGDSHTKAMVEPSTEHPAPPVAEGQDLSEPLLSEETHCASDYNSDCSTMSQCCQLPRLCMDGQVTPTHSFTPTSPESCTSSLQENGVSELEDPLLHDTSSLRLTTPVRNAAVRRFWQQQTLKLELELKEEKIASLSRELEDLSFTGKVEEEVATLKKAKHDLELRVKDQ
ncbi:hypothetical protein Hamer_G004307, partial [Homarus americanus]